MLNTYMDMTAFFLSNHNIFLHIYIVMNFDPETCVLKSEGVGSTERPLSE